MKTIYKYPFNVNDTIKIQMPVDAQVLSVQVQAGSACIWALVDPSNQTEERVFHCRGTGHGCNGLIAAKFVGTFQMLDGRLVFHLFEA